MTYVFYVYLHNKADCQDDEVIKFRSRTATEARRLASQWNDSNRCRFRVGKAYRSREFQKAHPDWYKLLSGHAPEPNRLWDKGPEDKKMDREVARIAYGVKKR